MLGCPTETTLPSLTVQWDGWKIGKRICATSVVCSDTSSKPRKSRNRNAVKEGSLPSGLKCLRHHDIAFFSCNSTTVNPLESAFGLKERSSVSWCSRSRHWPRMQMVTQRSSRRWYPRPSRLHGLCPDNEQQLFGIAVCIASWFHAHQPFDTVWSSRLLGIRKACHFLIIAANSHMCRCMLLQVSVARPCML